MVFAGSRGPAASGLGRGGGWGVGSAQGAEPQVPGGWLRGVVPQEGPQPCLQGQVERRAHRQPRVQGAAGSHSYSLTAAWLRHWGSMIEALGGLSCTAWHQLLYCNDAASAAAFHPAHSLSLLQNGFVWLSAVGQAGLTKHLRRLLTAGQQPLPKRSSSSPPPAPALDRCTAAGLYSHVFIIDMRRHRACGHPRRSPTPTTTWMRRP